MTFCLNPNCPRPQNSDNAKFCQNCGSLLWLGDRFRAIRLIAQGGFGRTLLAVDEQAESSVEPSAESLENDRDRTEPQEHYCVIKQIMSRYSGISQARTIELFRQEVDRLAELGQHPQIPKLLAHFEQNEAQLGDAQLGDAQLGDAQFLVQEYIAGQNLEEILAKAGVFSEAQVRQLLADLLPVLRFVHGHQVIHRDIKPENIIRPGSSRSPQLSPQASPQASPQLSTQTPSSLTLPTDRYVLVDFGASKLAVTAPGRTGTVIGSAGYVAPEQAMGKAEFASDLYSLGVTCIHLLTGLHPFDLYSISEDAWVWRQYLPRPVSSELRRVLDKLLQRATRQRYPTATAVLQDLHLDSRSRLATETCPASLSENRSTAQPRLPQSSQAQSILKSSPVLGADWQCVRTLVGHTGAVTTIAISPDDRLLVSGSQDKTVKLWDLSNGDLLHTFAARSFWSREGHGETIRSLRFSPAGDTLFSGSEDGAIKEWDVATYQLVTDLPAQGWGLSALSLTPDGWTLITGGRDGAIHLWDLETGELMADLIKHQEQITGLLVRPDQRRLLSSSYDKTIRLWDIERDTLMNTIGAHVDTVSAIVVTPNWRMLISSSWDKTIKFWDLNRQEQIKVIAAHRDRIHCLAIDRTGEIFASGSEDSSIKFWSVQTGERLCTVQHDWAVNAIEFSGDGRVLVSGSADETIKVWRSVER